MPAPSTHAERVAMLEQPHMRSWLSRLEVLDVVGNVVDEIAGRVTGCRVRHEADIDVHRSCELTTFADLAWDRHYVKPWLYTGNSTNGLEAETPLGVFLLGSPRPSADRRPRQFTVTCLDRLTLLHQPLDRAVSFPSGAFVLDSIRQLMTAKGVGATGDLIANDRGGDTLAAPRVWPISEDHTYLSVINDLLEHIAYDRLAMTGDGQPYAQPKLNAAERPMLWTYDAQAPLTLVKAEGRDLEHDPASVPNVFPFVMANTQTEEAPVEGDGLFTYRNHTEGPSSIEARGGREVVAPVEALEAATQADLEVNGMAVVRGAIYAGRTYRWRTWPNPYHGHLDLLDIVDRDWAFAGQGEERVWDLDVFARTHDHEAVAVGEGVVA